jgi:plasmid stabilization system protein ParE
MSASPIEFHPEAAQEVEAAVLWYGERSLRAAEAFLKELENALRLISEAPARWPAFEAGTRRLPLRRFPYVVIYREGARALQILAVAHGRRRPGYWKSRSPAPTG